MRKHRKLAAVLSTTAVLTAFAPLFTTPVLAQSAGWVQENENWSYYDSDGYKLTGWRMVLPGRERQPCIQYAD